jgi:hypothetical protein
MYKGRFEFSIAGLRCKLVCPLPKVGQPAVQRRRPKKLLVFQLKREQHGSRLHTQPTHIMGSGVATTEESAPPGGRVRASDGWPPPACIMLGRQQMVHRHPPPVQPAAASRVLGSSSRPGSSAPGVWEWPPTPPAASPLAATAAAQAGGSDVAHPQETVSWTSFLSCWPNEPPCAPRARQPHAWRQAGDDGNRRRPACVLCTTCKLHFTGFTHDGFHRKGSCRRPVEAHIEQEQAHSQRNTQHHS